MIVYINELKFQSLVKLFFIDEFNYFKNLVVHRLLKR